MPENSWISDEVSRLLRRADMLFRNVPEEQHWIVYETIRQSLSYLAGPDALHDKDGWKTDEIWDSVVSDLDLIARKHKRT